MPRSAPRRPSPIALPNCPMDTLWEVDESSPDLQITHQFQPSRRPSDSSWFASPPSSSPLRSIFEDDDDEEEDDLRFPLPPRSVPVASKPSSSKSMSLPIQPAPQRTPSPTKSFTPSPRSSSLYAPRRAPAAVSFSTRQRVLSPPTPVTPPRRHPRAEVQRPVSPTSSASSSDTEPPRTPPAASSSLPCARSDKPVRILPPTEWESAIDALYAFDSDDEEDEQPSFVQPRPAKRSSTVAAPPMPTRAPPPPPRSRARPQSRYDEDDDDSRSYLSWSPVSSPGPLSPTQLPMSPMFGRALNSPGFMPTSPTSDHGHSFSRPPRSSRRSTAVPERSMIPVELLFSMSS